MNHSILSISTPAESGASGVMGRMLRELGKLTAEDTEHVLRLQRERGLRFGEAARSLGLVTEADIERVLALQFSYPYLQPGEGKYPSELVAAYKPSSPQVMALRAVRSQLLLSWFERGRKALAVICINPGDGGSFFCANLAVVFAQLGKQTLLVDANLRRPRQHRIFNLKARQGLSDLLAGRAGMETIEGIEGLANLSVLPAGTVAPNPQELVSHGTFSEVHDNLADQFEVILLDAPAYSSGADAFDIAARLGGALLVVRKDKTRLADVNAARAQLAHNGVAIVGSVLIDF